MRDSKRWDAPFKSESIIKPSRRKFISDFCFITGGVSLSGPGCINKLIHGRELNNDSDTWWIGTDPHVAYRAMRIREGYNNNLENCIKDVNQLKIADKAIILGDLGGADLLKGSDKIQTGEKTSRFFDAMNNLNVKEWYYITGNHEFNDEGGIVIPSQYWSQNVLGIRFIFISDEIKSYGGEMKKVQEEWFFTELNKHAKQPIFIFSHQGPDRHGSWNFWDTLEKQIMNFNIQAWFHGHEHVWSIDNDTKYGFRRIGIAPIYEYTGKEKFPTGDEAHNNGCFIVLKKIGKEINVTIRFRNHIKREWIVADGFKEINFAVTAL